MIQIISFDIGIRNLALCILTYEESTKHSEIKIWKKVDLCCKKSDASGLIDSLVKFLDTIVQEHMMHDLDTFVIIENQMTAVMKCLQASIYTYFKVMRSILDMSMTTIYINPKLKLKLVDHFKDYKSESQQHSQKYKQNKVDSVDLTKWILTTHYKDSDSYEFFLSSPKNDDLADCYNQAVAWALLAYKSI